MNTAQTNQNLNFINLMDTPVAVFNSSAEFIEQNSYFKEWSHSQSIKSEKKWNENFQRCLQNGSSRFAILAGRFDCVMSRASDGDCKIVMLQVLEASGEDSLQINDLLEMTSAVAHEINNPLTVISVRSQMLQQTLTNNDMPSADKLLQYVDKVAIQSERIKNMVDRIRAFSRNSTAVQNQNCSLRTLINDSFALASIREKNIEFHFDLDSEDKLIAAKPSELVQALIGVFKHGIEALADIEKPQVKIHFTEDEEAYGLFITGNAQQGPESRTFAPFSNSRSDKTLQIYGDLHSVNFEGRAGLYLKLFKSQDSSRNTQAA